MAILNETSTMSTVNMWMLAAGILAVVSGGLLFTIWIKIENFAAFVAVFLLSMCLTIGGFTVGILSGQPDYQHSLGKKQIEAVFPKGKPNAYILEKYNVIEQRGRIWVMEEK